MVKFWSRSLWIAFSLLLSINAFGNSKQVLADVLALYKEGDYVVALEKLDELVKYKRFRALGNYWRGNIYSKTQEYDRAVEFFAKAIRQGHDEPNIHYEYGQALYANDQLKLARQAFGKSVKKRYKIGTSLYYIGFISQTLGDNPLAIRYYNMIAKLPEKYREDTLQAAMYQLGEVYLIQARKHPSAVKVVKKFVIPQFERAMAQDSSYPLAKDIDKKIYKIKKEFNLIITKMRNGKRVPRKRYNATLTAETRYDSNIVLKGDESTTEYANEGSSLYTLTAFGRHLFTVSSLVQVNPEIRYTKTYHFVREDPNIYSNDSYGIAPSLRTIWEHLLFGKMASFLADIEYSYNAADIGQNQQLRFSNRSITYSLGDQFSYFSFGQTTVKLRKKYTYSFNPDNNSYTDSINATQIVKIPGGHTLVAIGTISYIRNNVETSDTDTYNIVLNYIIPRWRWFNLPTLGLSYTMTDTKLNKATRGTEHGITPSLRLSKFAFKGKLKTTLKLDYTKQISQDKVNNAYTKWTAGLEFAYNF